MVPVPGARSIGRSKRGNLKAKLSDGRTKKRLGAVRGEAKGTGGSVGGKQTEEKTSYRDKALGEALHAMDSDW